MVHTVLQEVVGEENIQALQEDTHPLGNHAPYIVFPQTETDIASFLKVANQHSLDIIPVGGGTKRGFGGIEEKADYILSLSHMSGIVGHSAGDMTMTVRPGTRIGEIADELAKHEQMIPLDPFWPEHATIGGVIAANDSGPKRLGYGSARDHVIGLRLVYPDGRIIRSGGKVVKNVAGYDMNKLFIGSMGTLGVLSEVTVKLRPLPQYQSLVLLHFNQDDLQKVNQFVIRLLDSTLEPCALEVLSPQLNQRLNARNEIGLAIAFEDVPKAVQYQEEWVGSNLPSGTEIEILSQEQASAWWSALAELPPRAISQSAPHETEIGLKIGSKNMQAIDLVDCCHRLGTEENIQVEAHGGAGHGISRAYVKGNTRELASFVNKLRSTVQGKKGYVVIQHAPLHFRQEVETWGEKPSYFPLLEGIKHSLDPNRILNPKRFVGGL